MKTVDFSETIAACDLKCGRCRKLIVIMKVYEGQGHFFSIYFPGFVIICFTRSRYQVSVYRTIGPLVSFILPLVVAWSTNVFQLFS